MCSTIFIKVSSDKKNSASRVTGEVKFTIDQTRKAQRGRRFLALNFGVRWGGWLKQRPGRFNPGKRTGANCTGSWLLPRAGLDGCGKSRPNRIGSPDHSPIASRHTDCSIAAHECSQIWTHIYIGFYFPCSLLNSFCRTGWTTRKGWWTGIREVGQAERTDEKTETTKLISAFCSLFSTRLKISCRIFSGHKHKQHLAYLAERGT